MTLLHFLILALAVWRVGNMLADSDQSGPFELLDRFRAFAGIRYTPDGSPLVKHASFASGLLCVDCNSVWLGIIAAIGYLVLPEMAIVVSLPFALSAVAKVIETYINRE